MPMVTWMQWKVDMARGAHILRRDSDDLRSIVAGLIISLLLSSFMILGTSRAAWTATTETSSSSVSAGTLSLTDDDTPTALLSVTGLFPGDSESQCIKVTYGSTPNPNVVKVYSTALTDADGLAQWVNLKIEEGDGGSFRDCTGFGSATEIFNDDLAVWAGKTSYANGVGVWDPTGDSESKTYKLTVTLDVNAPSSVQNDSVTGIEFTWETQA